MENKELRIEDEERKEEEESDEETRTGRRRSPAQSRCFYDIGSSVQSKQKDFVNYLQRGGSSL